MSPRTWSLGAALSLAAIVGAASALLGQGNLRTRVEGSGDGRVQFRYAARADVCGYGSSISIGRSTYVSTGNMNVGDAMDRVCRRGPVVVRITRAGGQV